MLNKQAYCPLLIVCEHASNYIPPFFQGLGISNKACNSHIAWDLGAASVAHLLSVKMNACLVKSEVSRLIYDCNRPPNAKDAIPNLSEIYEIPGNDNLSEEERQFRIKTVYEPFSSAVSQAVKKASALVTIHSFTPVYHGQKRPVEIGIIHDTDTRMADEILKIAPSLTKLDIRRNQPYGPQDGVAHTLNYHGNVNKIPNVMIEIRNDLLDRQENCEKIATLIKALLEGAMERLGIVDSRQRVAL